jgi:hydrophobic/amphiphilic exporter-1 (mainly G- bacteria), HAE1 family
MEITKISIKRPSLVVVLFTILIFLGAISYFSLNYELIPKFSPPILTVSTVYPGASPYEVENSVSKELENTLSSLENIDQLRTTSIEGVSIIVIQLKADADVDLALQEAQRKINTIMGNLPEDVRAPALNKFSFDDLPIMRMGATADMEATKFYDVVENRIQPALARIPGVAQINIIGGEEREIRVNINRERLNAYNLSILQVSQLIQNANLDFPTGKIKTNEDQVLVRLAGKYESLDQMRNLVVTVVDGAPVRLKDIAEVQDTKKEATMITRVDRVNSLGISILKQSDANAVEVSRLVNAEITKLQKIYAGDNLRFSIASDSSGYTLEAADSVIHDLFIAIILVAIVMLLFLHSLRNAIIVMIAVPLSLISTFIAINLLDYSLNLMTLLALSLVVGILVDDAIVVIENIYRHMEMGKSRARAAFDGVKEIGFTVVSITMVIVVVFFPIALTSGLISNLMKQFSIVVVISTLLSLLVSFTVIPLLSSRFSKLEHLSNKNLFGRFILGFEGGIDGFASWLKGILVWALGHKFVTIAVTFVLFVAAVALVPMGFIGAEFVTQGDRGEFIVQVEMPKDATLEQTNLATRKIEDILAEKPEITSLFTTVGQQSTGGVGGSAQGTAYAAEITVKVVPEDQREHSSNILASLLKNELEAKVPEAKIKTTPISIMGTANQAPIDIIVKGPTLDSVMVYANKVLEEVKKVSGTTEMKLSVEAGNPEIFVAVDRDKMASLGLSLEMVGATMQTAFNGNNDAKFRQGEYDYDINIKFDDFDRKSIDDIKALSLVNNKGQLIRLDQFAAVKESTGPSRLERKDRITSVSVQSQVIGRPSGTVTAEIRERLAKLDPPTEVSYEFGGDAQNQSEAFSSLLIAFASSILLVYLILVALYDNYVYPFVVLFSIPLAMVGSLLALAMTQNTLSIFTILGIIMLIGLVAKNAILVVDFTNHLKEKGMKTKDALVEATQERLRPILMTTIAMVIGMLPIAIATGPGAAWKNGLAWAIIGGLISSMFLTLVVIPVAYQIVDSVLARLGLDKKGHDYAKELDESEGVEEKHIEELMHA